MHNEHDAERRDELIVVPTSTNYNQFMIFIDVFSRDRRVFYIMKSKGRR